MSTPANVTRGAAFLDERLPGWRDEVDPDSLYLSSECGCVLGHIFGDYSKGMAVLKLTDYQARRLGFWRAGSQTWDRLSEGWRKVIRNGR